jgi:hypothetical protein
VSYNGGRFKRVTMGKGRPAPISSFGAGQGENNISVSEWKGEIGPPPILPFGGGQCEFRVCMG